MKVISTDADVVLVEIKLFNALKLPCFAPRAQGLGMVWGVIRKSREACGGSTPHPGGQTDYYLLLPSLVWLKLGSEDTWWGSFSTCPLPLTLH